MLGHIFGLPFEELFAVAPLAGASWLALRIRRRPRRDPCLRQADPQETR